MSARLTGVIDARDDAKRVAADKFIEGLVGTPGSGNVVNDTDAPLTLWTNGESEWVCLPLFQYDKNGELMVGSWSAVISYNQFSFDASNSPEKFGVTVLEVMDPRELFELRAVRDGKASVPLMDGAL